MHFLTVVWGVTLCQCSSHLSEGSQCFKIVRTAPSEITSHPRRPESSAAPLTKPQISYSYLLVSSLELL